LPATAERNLRRPISNLNWTEDADKHRAILRGSDAGLRPHPATPAAGCRPQAIWLR